MLKFDEAAERRLDKNTKNVILREHQSQIDPTVITRVKEIAPGDRGEHAVHVYPQIRRRGPDVEVGESLCVRR